MAKIQDSFYFENFLACADCACQAAYLLEKAMKDFDPGVISEKLDEIHAVEHAGDEKKHELINVLARAFITPIEREDILLLSQNIDDLTDKIEDVLLRIYCNNVQTIRPDALKLLDVIIRCCEAVQKLMTEFADFKRSDRLFISGMRHLHTSCRDPLTVISWREIYIYLEKCVDACEHAADTVESVVMKNS